jgi:hypothetical protein
MSYDLMGNLARTAAGSGKFVNFKTIGQWATIEVLRGRDWKAPKANKDGSYDEAPALDGRYVAGNVPDFQPGTDATLILSGHKGTAVMEAVANAGVAQVTYPFTVTIGFTHEQDTGEIQPMKRYQAKVEFPPQAQAPNPFGGQVPVPTPAAQAPQGPPPAPFGAPQAPAGPAPVQYAPQAPAAPSGPPPAPPYAMVDGQWVAPGDPRYPGAPPPEAPSPFGGAPAPAEGAQEAQGGNGMAGLFS